MKPVYLMFESGISPVQQSLVLQGLREILKLANTHESVKVKNFGIWRNTNWLSGKTLEPYQSVDWYCNQAFDQKRNQLNGDQIANALASEPWQRMELHHDIVITKRDLYFEGTNWAFGCATRGLMAIASVHRFEQFIAKDKILQNQCFKTIAMHEIGHMFGLVNPKRKDIEENLGGHCVNSKCIMRQGLSLQPWIGFTHDRLSSMNPICPSCQHDLQNYFLNK